MTDPPITLPEVKEIRHIGVRRLQVAIRAGKLHAFRDETGRYRTTLAWVDAWLERLAAEESRQRADRRTAGTSGKSRRRKAKAGAKTKAKAGSTLRRNPDGTVEFH